MMALCGDMEILVPMAGVVDTDTELTRLEKEIKKIIAEVKRHRDKLNNTAFLERAPPSVVAAEKEKREQAEASLKALEEQRIKIQELRSN